VILPHAYRADFVIWDKILFEAKAVEKLTDAHVKQVLNYLAASKLRLGLLVNFGSDSLEWKRVICKFVLIRGIRVSMNSYHLDHLQYLETEAIHVMREVAAEFERPALLFSGGKDSICLLRLAEKAFRPSDIPCRSSTSIPAIIFPN